MPHKAGPPVGGHELLLGQFELGSWEEVELQRNQQAAALLHACCLSQLVSLELATAFRTCDQDGPEPQAYRGRKMVLDPLELELQIVVRHHDSAGNPPLVLWGDPPTLQLCHARV